LLYVLTLPEEILPQYLDHLFLEKLLSDFFVVGDEYYEVRKPDFVHISFHQH
jgi:hypothetical protein